MIVKERGAGADTAPMSTQLVLFSADRYHDPRVAADRARVRSAAKLRPVHRVDPTRGAAGIVVQLRDPVAAHVGGTGGSRHAA